jgi:hypothetical protein
MIPKVRGFILVEFLLAALLFLIVSAGLYAGLIQGLKTKKKINESFREYDPIRIFFAKIEKDLRNSTNLKEYPFKGKANEIQFPVWSPNAPQEQSPILLVRYFVKENSVIRGERVLDASLSNPKERQHIALKNMKSIHFFFPYEDGDGNRKNEDFWLEDPYMGIPRVLKIEVLKDSVDKTALFEKNVSIPQGRMGHIQERT